VAEADGLVHPTEEAEIRQIAAELGIAAGEPATS
jgi:tellurite resistance protein